MGGDRAAVGAGHIKLDAAVVVGRAGRAVKEPQRAFRDAVEDAMHGFPRNALYVRSVLSMTIADALIAVFDSKYVYWRARPIEREKSLKTIVVTPNHPSYPAGYAAMSSAAQVVLTRFFPERSQELLQQAKEATGSRHFAGTQFESDNVAGTSLGVSVANSVLEKVTMPL
jgi:hypothetical protein